MTQVALSPVFNDTQFCDNSGLPLAGGKVFTYEAGSFTVEQATFTSIAGNVANTNPIVLDSAGRMPTAMWLISGSAYNIVLTQADGTTVLVTHEDIRGSMPVPTGVGLGTVIWNIADLVPEYVSSTQFLLVGDYTEQFAVGNRVRWQFNNLSYAYGTVTNVIYADPSTQVTVELDSTGLNTDIINVAWSALVSTNATVDAAGVSFSEVITYVGNNVGTELIRLAALIESNATVWGTTNGSPAFVLTPSVETTLYVGGKWSVRFTASSLDQECTLNISNRGAYPIKQYTPSGTFVDAQISAGMISDVAWDDPAQVFVLLNPLPSVPTGTIAFYGAETAPSGWLVCDGSDVSEATYASLFAVIGYTFGAGEGSFALPNLLGQFVRGYDSTGLVDPGRVFGSLQEGQMESHNHRMWWTYYDGGGGRGLIDPVNPSNITTEGQSTSGQTGWGVDFAGTGTETRPTNVALLPCIKY